MIRKFDLSVALFAHGWTNETADNWDQFIDNECRSASLFPVTNLLWDLDTLSCIFSFLCLAYISA